MQNFNISYIANINGPYDYQHMFNNENGIDYVRQFDEIFGHRKHPEELLHDPNLYILDTAPTIMRDFPQNPSMILSAVASPSFGVSLFDVDPTVEGSNQKWFSIIQKLHSVIQNAIENDKELNGDVIRNLVEKAYRHYQNCLDRTYTSELYSPCENFLAIALMDVYHIINKVYHDVEYLNFQPKFLMTSDAPENYIRNYSAIFSMNPFMNEGKNMSRQMFNQMQMDLSHYDEINDFLAKHGMQEVIKSRKDHLNAYNSETFEIMKNYVFLCLKCIQSSPLIKNKHDIMETLLKTNHCVDRKHAAMCFFFFKDCIDSLIQSNLLEEESPFVFKHDLGDLGKFYCPIPPLIH